MGEALPKTLGKYRITRILGKGAMGVVYEGTDPGIGRQVAIKTIHKHLLEGESGQELLSRFKREAQSAGQLNHPNVVTVYEYVEEQGVPFIAMEFVKGRELKQYITERARFEVSQILNVMTKTLSAMAYVHSVGVIHRDIKPANILLLENCDLKVSDFGIARMRDSTMTQIGAVMGTPSYMSPEQFMGQRVDERTDLFSVAVILYELLTGEKPFPGEAVSTIMQKVLYAPVEPPTTYNLSIPNAFNAVLEKALAKRPMDRFQSAKDFIEAITLAAEDKYSASLGSVDQGAYNEGETLISGRGKDATILERVDDRQGVPNTPAGPASKRSIFPVIVGVLGGLLVAAGGGWFIQKQSSVTSLPPLLPVETPKVEGISKPKGFPATGTINALSKPSGAIILVGGEFLGVTPHRFDLAIGEYQIMLKKKGFHTLEAGLEVEKNEVFELNVVLDPL